MESQNFGHMHPMVFNEERGNETKEAHCGRCGEMVSGPWFSCAECGFSLHSKCAKAPSPIHHPFHRNHPLVLLPKSPYKSGRCICNFCGEKSESFVYHCSCQIDLHIKCALFTLSIAEKKPEELKHIATIDPPVEPGEGNKLPENCVCFGCWEPLGESTYFSIDCGFNLHKKCAQLPHEINHPFHKQHPLVLQFSVQLSSCNICQRTRYRGFLYCCSPCKFEVHIKCAELPSKISNPSHRRHALVLQSNHENIPCKACPETQNPKFVYSCSPCKFALHTECATPPPFIKGKYHEHPFTLFWKVSFICDACGLEGNSVSYICSACNFVIHPKCASIPPIIKVRRHHHPVFHNYFLSGNEFKNRVCEFCDTEVNIDHGSYFCSDCNFIAHVKCAMKEGFYVVIEAKDLDEELDDDLASINPITRVIDLNEAGEMTRIKHFSHAHNLILSDNFMDNDKTCDGCMLLISASFYYCSSYCDFYLHKTCARSPRKKLQWSHRHIRGLILVVGYIFKCRLCYCESSGFAYNVKIRDRCDEHPLALTYQEDNDYSEYLHCDICEKRRDQNHWFYHCATCDFSAHPQCVPQSRLLIKPGSTYKAEGHHPHPLTFVRKPHYYLRCNKCSNLCQDLALQCADSTCNYTVHWGCVKPVDFDDDKPVALYKTQADC
ncbi:Detected protein of confused Function [Hibiscus syriacus]|uniref:Detected protein of confused Function n=1 Tax=Hibiscus syriacus TaxID=106335 RepID=A0A6A2Y945_HIBSY|nr:Detected protein of confused Function [Hibiscus syriacus]